MELALILAMGIGASAASVPVGRLFALDSNVARGAAPDRMEEFRFLKDVGIRTIVSFDRKTPDYAKAESVGLAYAHVPIGYGTVSDTAMLDFFSVLNNPQTPPPYYLHCHGGKYRVGAMAALYRIQYNGWTPDSANAEMLRLGGKIDYLGLNASIRNFKPIPAKAIAAHVFDPAARTTGKSLGHMMVDINKTFNELKRMTGKGMEAGELSGIALGLEEIYYEIHRLKACPPCDSTGYRLFLESAQSIQAARTRTGFSPEWFKAIKQDCNQCHSRYRQ